MQRIVEFDVPLGQGFARGRVPEGWHATLLEPTRQAALPDLGAAIAEALDAPMGSVPLAILARERADRARAAGVTPTATVVVTDATRDCPDDQFLPPLLAAIEGGGILADDTTLLVATGLHRPSTADEKRAKLGRDIADRYRVVDHDARDPRLIVEIGRTRGGIPATVNRLALEADLLVATGVVEPHQYAGWSGGAKTVAIGVAGEATIAATHGPSMIDEPGVRLGSLDGNPFHEAVVELGGRAGLAFVVNVVLDADNRALAVAAGEPEVVHHVLAERAARAVVVPLDRQADVAIAGVGAPKDANLYQASRAVTYLHFAPIPAVRPGGVYVLPATIPEGAGAGLGERRFAEALAWAAGAPDGPAELQRRLRRDGARAGEQRAYMVAAVLRDASIIVVGAGDPGVPLAAGFRAAPDLGEALELAGELARTSLSEADRGRPLDLLIVPHAIRTLPIVAARPPSSPS
ncbi:MAG TPA: nickel-dependent lactate racemase [Candidatus Limnocylindrales bacterium]